LTVSDDRGRVRAEWKSSDALEVRAATVEAGLGGTFYRRFGDWFAWVSLIVLATCFTRVARVRTVRGS
jgi:apolipoprotein N-acyltransferase